MSPIVLRVVCVVLALVVLGAIVMRRKKSA